MNHDLRCVCRECQEMRVRNTLQHMLEAELAFGMLRGYEEPVMAQVRVPGYGKFRLVAPNPNSTWTVEDRDFLKSFRIKL